MRSQGESSSTCGISYSARSLSSTHSETANVGIKLTVVQLSESSTMLQRRVRHRMNEWQPADPDIEPTSENALSSVRPIITRSTRRTRNHHSRSRSVFYRPLLSTRCPMTASVVPSMKAPTARKSPRVPMYHVHTLMAATPHMTIEKSIVDQRLRLSEVT